MHLLQLKTNTTIIDLPLDNILYLKVNDGNTVTIKTSNIYDRFTLALNDLNKVLNNVNYLVDKNTAVKITEVSHIKYSKENCYVFFKNIEYQYVVTKELYFKILNYFENS